VTDELAHVVAHEISCLIHELRAGREQREKEFQWRKDHWGLATKTDLQEMEKRIMATQAEAAQTLRDVVVQLKKSDGEIKTVQASVDTLNKKIADLEAVISAGGDASQELIDAVAAVKAQAQVVDDEIPDPVVIPPSA
jgi:chromosome segregation ATPase